MNSVVLCKFGRGNTFTKHQESFSWMDFCCSTGRTWELGRKIKGGSGKA